MTPSSHSTLPAGHTLADSRYTIVRNLTVGNHGAVYLATDERLQARQVAIKESRDQSQEARQLFRQEAALLSTLSHGGLVHVSDFFVEEQSSYLVMDFIVGRTLEDVGQEAFRANRLLPVDQVLRWMIQICEAVAYLHHRRPPVIHRDIKPCNIHLNDNQDAVLVDFGSAKIGLDSKTLPMARIIAAGFSPPEQYSIQGGTDMRSDVYAVGATLYWLLTGTTPPDSFARLIENIPLITPRQLNPAVSAELEAVVLSALDLNSLRRYQDASEMLEALRAVPRPAPQQLAPPPQPQTPPAEGPTCPVCGHSSRPEARFCPKCGFSFSSRDGSPPTVRCATCRTPARPGAKFCALCGAALFVEAVPAEKPAPELSLDEEPIRQHLTRGNQHARTGQFEYAIMEYEQAQQNGADTPDVYIGLGRAYSQLQRYDEAIKLLETGARQYTQDAGIHTQLAVAYLGAQQLSQGLKTLETAHGLAPDNDDLALLLTDVYVQVGQFGKGIPLLERLLQRLPHHTEVRYRLAVDYLMTDQLHAAEDLIKQLQRQTRRKSEVSFLMGVLHQKGGQWKKALKDLQAAIRFQPDHALAHYVMGNIYLDQRKWKEAVGAYQKSAQANPHDPDAYLQLSQCYLALKHPDEALAALQRALQIDPSHQVALKIVAELRKQA